MGPIYTKITLISAKDIMLVRRYITTEELGVLIHPQRQELIVNPDHYLWLN